MRNIALLASFLPLAVSAQFIVLSFEATLNGTPAPLDSVLVMNLTQGGDTTIYFPDNTLILGGTTGLDAYDDGDMRMHCLANPFSGSTEIVVGALTQGEMHLVVHDGVGRELSSYTFHAVAGQHHFRYTSGASGVQVLTVLHNGQRRSMRMVATEGGSSELSTLVHSGVTQGAGGLKDNRALFEWQPGDVLRYIGYGSSGGFVASASIDEAPTVTSTKVFPLVLGAVCIEAPTMTDIMGNVYPVVRIGDQCWMGANLRTTFRRNGVPIENVTVGNFWVTINTAAWCDYNNSPFNPPARGKLYNWWAAADPNICPLGWHVPTDTEWQQLEITLGMPTVELGETGYRGGDQNVGGKINGWLTLAQGATNESGFSGLPAGYRNLNGGEFADQNTDGYWWSATNAGGGRSWSRGIGNTNPSSIGRFFSLQGFGFCVRCIQD
jgi:uncharacterized protein (TIGR02145 family)